MKVSLLAVLLLSACAAPGPVIPPDATWELLWGEGEFTEGPALAPDGSIYFSDIGNRIMRFDPKTTQTAVYRDPGGRSNGMKFDAKGRLVVCEGGNTGGGQRISITESDGKVRTLADRWEGKRFNSPNDLAIDPKGNVYFTDPRYVGDEPREIDFEGVFRITLDGKVTLATKDVQKPNGIIVTPDGATAYVADTNSDPKGNHQLVAFTIAADGSFTNKRLLHDFGPDRRPIDGMTLGRDGNIYAAAGAKKNEDGGLWVFSPKGEKLGFLATPGDPTNVCFAADGMTLYITAQAGKKWGLYRVKLPVNR
jgi:gluconolactonase